MLATVTFEVDQITLTMYLSVPGTRPSVLLVCNCVVQSSYLPGSATGDDQISPAWYVPVPIQIPDIVIRNKWLTLFFTTGG